MLSHLQMLGFEPIAPGASADAELGTVRNQALHNPAAPPGTLQVRIPVPMLMSTIMHATVRSASLTCMCTPFEPPCLLAVNACSPPYACASLDHFCSCIMVLTSSLCSSALCSDGCR